MALATPVDPSRSGLDAEMDPTGYGQRGDLMDHLLEGFQRDWRVPETYVNGKLALQFDLRRRSRDDDGSRKHKVVVIQRAPGVDLGPLDGGADITDPDDIQVKAVGSAFDGVIGGEQCPMLVFVRKATKGSKRVCPWAVRSVVWLAELDEPLGGGMETTGHGIPPLSVAVAALVRRSLVEDRKGVPISRRLPVRLDHLPNEVIEGGTEVLDEVSGDETELNWRGPVDANEGDVARCLHIHLGDETVGLGFRLHKGANFRVERLKMRTRSLNLGDDALKRTFGPRCAQLIVRDARQPKRRPTRARDTRP